MRIKYYPVESNTLKELLLAILVQDYIQKNKIEHSINHHILAIRRTRIVAFHFIRRQLGEQICFRCFISRPFTTQYIRL